MMTLEAFYQQLGGDYNAVLARIPGESLVRRFVGAFQNDPSFEELCNAMEAGDRKTAFRAAHTLKGVCANLGFETLRQSAGILTETLRPEIDRIPQEATAQIEAVRHDYNKVISAISKLQSKA